MFARTNPHSLYRFASHIRIYTEIHILFSACFTQCAFVGDDDDANQCIECKSAYSPLLEFTLLGIWNDYSIDQPPNVKFYHIHINIYMLAVLHYKNIIKLLVGIKYFFAILIYIYVCMMKYRLSLIWNTLYAGLAFMDKL